MQSLCILGRQPALGLAELESLYGCDKLKPLNSQAVLLDIDPCLLATSRIGGSVKFCKVLMSLDTTDWSQISSFLEQSSPEHAQRLPKGKLHLGISVFGLKVSARQITATALAIKKAIQKSGHSVRIVANNQPALNSAQVIHNHLVGPNGWELVVVSTAKETILAQTIAEQDITSYTVRDRQRPKRDARVGMLPPKLAQIIINLASGPLPAEQLSSICDIPAGETIPRPDLKLTLLDPFCGTGVLLQEALLMGYPVVGSDLQPRLIDYSQTNLEWLIKRFKLVQAKWQLEIGDATTASWAPPVDIVASETYLGRPFTGPPNSALLKQTINDCNQIIKKFLHNINNQLKSGTQLCLALPAWQISAGQFQRLPLLDHLEELGYTRLKFVHAQNSELTYYREGQIVGRELVVLKRN